MEHVVYNVFKHTLQPASALSKSLNILFRPALLPELCYIGRRVSGENWLTYLVLEPLLDGYMDGAMF